MSAVVRRATATEKAETSSDLTQKRTTRTSTTTTNATAVHPPTVTVSEPEPAPTKRRSTLAKVVSETFFGLKNKAVDQVSRAFRSNQKKAAASTQSTSFRGISTRSAGKAAELKREASSEKESSPISTSVVSATLLAEPSHSPQTAPVASTDAAAPPAPATKPFLNEGLFSNVVSHPKSKYSKTSRAIRASKATAIEKGKVDGEATAANKILPLPLHWGLRKMEDRSEFLVPWDIMSEWQSGELDSQKSPTKYTKLRKSERTEMRVRRNGDLLLSFRHLSREETACADRLARYVSL